MTDTFKTIKNIMAELNDKIFIEMDAKILEQSKIWARARCAAIKEFKDNAPQSLRRDQFKYYAQLFAVAGGKTWYNVLGTVYNDRVEDFITKNCKATAEKRNAMIARKLEKAGVTEVSSTTYNRTNDGFNGTFVVETNAGRKVATVDSIYAGGYNIQCLHMRVLVKVR